MHEVRQNNGRAMIRVAVTPKEISRTPRPVKVWYPCEPKPFQFSSNKYALEE